MEENKVKIMEYNTTRGPLRLPEYGRNVQNMIAHAMTIENRTERNRAAQAIIEVMGQLNPHLRDVDDYRHKLWTHLFVMSDFKLDVDSPYPPPDKQTLNSLPQRVSYPKSNIRYGHYGQYTQKVLKVARTLEEQDKKEFLKKTMANFMKYQYMVHNNGTVENNIIANQLYELSEEVLRIDNPNEIVSTNILLRQIEQMETSQKRHNGMKKKNNNKKAKK